jgi:sugar phosphate isomerase/epimerase
MRLGISSFTYTWAIGVPGHPPNHPMDVMGLLDRAQALGVRLVQVADNLPLDRLPAAELTEFEVRSSQLGISVEVGTRGIAADHLRGYLKIARRFHSPILRVVIDTADHKPEPPEVAATLKHLVPEFEQAGVCLAIENHDRFKAATLADIITQIGSRYAGVCLDTVNSFGALEGPEVVLETLGPLVVNLHVKDFIVVRADHKMGFTIEGRPAGQGQLDVPWLLQKLRSHGRDVNAILELWTPPEANLEDTISKEAAWAIASIEGLRPLTRDTCNPERPSREG